MVRYFFDTYALIEIAKNSPQYVRFADEDITTTRFNLAELIYIVMSELGEKSAEKAFEKFRDSETHVSDATLFNAMKFRLKNKNRGLSYVDCIGYTFALENGLVFLTGDRAFSGLPGVEIVR